MTRRKNIAGPHRRFGNARTGGRVVGVPTTAAVAVTLATAPILMAPGTHAEFDGLLDRIVDPGSWAEVGAADGAFGPAGLDLAGSAAAVDGSWASVDTSLTDAVNNLIYQPIHNLGEWWITSPLTSGLNKVINLPFVALTGVRAARVATAATPVPSARAVTAARAAPAAPTAVPARTG